MLFKNIFVSILFLIAMTLAQTACEQQQPELFNWNLPPGFPEPVVPVENPMTRDKVLLGRYLFYDVRLSANQTQSCSSCHHQAQAFAEQRNTSVGSTGQRVNRNALSLTNVAYNATYTWAHNSLTTLEQQILIPLFNENPIEMGLTNVESAVLQRFSEVEKYRKLFRNAFSERDPINYRNIVDALACFVRSMVSFNSPFDRYAYFREDGALSASALRGLELFMSERLECRHCHGGFNFTQAVGHTQSMDEAKPFHNTGLYYPVELNGQEFDFGLFNVTGEETDKGLFKAPTLRNIEYTAPYMHDGSIATLENVIEFYADGGRNIESGQYRGDGRLDPNKDRFVKGFVLTDSEKQDLLTFLLSLSDNQFITNEQFSNPFFAEAAIAAE